LETASGVGHAAGIARGAVVDILAAIWAVLSFILGILWSLIWFVLRDLLSTIIWLVILVWLGFAVRYRSFTTGSLALLRFGRWGAKTLWRWLRGLPDMPGAPAAIREKVKVEYRRRIPFGYVSLSEQMNIVLVAFFITILLLSR
jgi:hypothetical protein